MIALHANNAAQTAAVLPLPVQELTSLDASTEAGKEALERIEEDIRTIPLAEIHHRHISASGLVGIGLYYAGRFKLDRDRFHLAFNPSMFDVERYDDMRDRALAFWYLSICMRQGDPASLRAILERAKPLRAKLLKAANYLWGDHPKLGAVIADIRTSYSHFDQADNMGALAKLFLERWEEARDNCSVTRQEVLEAEALGGRLLQAVARTKFKEISDLKALHNQAGEYLRRGIYDIRAAAALVFKGDGHHRARYPSISIMRKKRKMDADTHATGRPVLHRIPHPG